MAMDLATALEALCAVAPALAATVASSREEWAPDEPPATIVLGELGTALVESCDALGDGALEGAARVIETALEHGSKDVQDAVATGLIEAAMNAATRDPRGVRFLRQLGPLARGYARAWDEFGGVKTPGIWDDPA
jgi:hypothetical protein